MSQNFTFEDTQLAEMRPSIGPKLPHPSDPGTVTITISREDAERWASDDDHIHATAWGPVDKAIRAALEGERCGDTVASGAVFAVSANATITISREDAEEMADFFTDPSKKFLLGRLALACQAALEGER